MNLQPANFSTHWMANKLKVSRSGYYTWLHRLYNPGPRAQKEETIAKAIDPIFTEHKERYGSFRIHQELHGQGFGVSRKRVARIMKKKGLKTKCRKLFKKRSPLESRQLRETFWKDSSTRSGQILPGLATSPISIQQMGGDTWLSG